MRPVDTILTALANRLATAPGLEGADAFFADRMGALPRAICAWMGGPVTMPFASLLIAKHRVDIFVVVATRASMTGSAQNMASITENVIQHLYGDVTLGGNCTRMVTQRVRPTTIGLGGETYACTVITVEIEDKSPQAVS